jgi:hypothetical protein
MPSIGSLKFLAGAGATRKFMAAVWTAFIRCAARIGLSTMSRPTILQRRRRLRAKDEPVAGGAAERSMSHRVPGASPPGDARHGRDAAAHVSALPLAAGAGR